MKKYLISGVIAVLAFASIAAAQGYTFSNNLSVGSSGQDVVNLQTWLIANGYDIPAISSGAAGKGYFGSQTKLAVMAYQRSVGLPAFGFFGPLTRSRVNSSDYRGASLQVMSPNGGEIWQKGTTHKITWTGSSGILNQTADIRLEFPVPACALPTANPRCMIAVRAPMTIASGINLNSGSYAWIVGSHILPNNQGTVPDCYGGDVNNCISSSYFVSDGEYKIQICPTNGSQCDESDNYFTITSGSTTTPCASSYVCPPIINGLDVPTTLAIGQMGTWTIHATDPQNSQLSYSVDWGDTVYPMSGYISTDGGLQFTQTTTFTHSYANAGTYTIRVTVRNASGLTAQTSSTVQVTSSTTAGPLKIVSPNGGEIWTKGRTQNITWTSPYYFAAAYADLKLLPTMPPCPAGSMCPMYMPAPYTIATNIPINQNSYSWNVGSVIPINASGYGIPTNVSVVPDGQYTIQLCQTGTSNCDPSDGTFTIRSTAY